MTKQRGESDEVATWSFGALNTNVRRDGTQLQLKDAFTDWQVTKDPETGQDAYYLPVYDEQGQVIGSAWPSGAVTNAWKPGDQLTFSMHINAKGWADGTEQQPVRSMESSSGDRDPGNG